MDRQIHTAAVTLVLMAIIISGCGSQEQPIAETSPPEVIVLAPTATTAPPPEPTDTAEPTALPSPTPLPGSMVLPLDTLAEGIPWLPYDPAAVPGTYFIMFNFNKPPFNSVLVRQAFAAAVDKQALVDITVDLYASQIFDPKPATNLTPPEVLGRDVTHQIGIAYDPAAAVDLLKQAGYEDTSGFPPVTILVNATGSVAVGYNIKMADTMAAMWQEVLGVAVEVEFIENFSAYGERLRDNPTELVRVFWAADFNDPDNFLRSLFQTGSEFNFGSYSNPEFDRLVEEAAAIQDPAQRQLLYLEAERILCEQDVAVLPIYHAMLDVR